jgi:hypothetical protein
MNILKTRNYPQIILGVILLWVVFTILNFVFNNNFSIKKTDQGTFLEIQSKSYDNLKITQ